MEFKTNSLYFFSGAQQPPVGRNRSVSRGRAQATTLRGAKNGPKRGGGGGRGAVQQKQQATQPIRGRSRSRGRGAGRPAG